jgi:hypothetical protein
MASGKNELGREQEGEREREMVKSVRDRERKLAWVEKMTVGETPENVWQIIVSQINNVNQSGN